MEKLSKVLLIFAGLINVFPVVGVLSSEVLERLYGIADLQGDLLILMRHRAVLLGILGLLIIASAFRRHLRPAAITAGLVSMLVFVVLAFAADGYGARLHSIVLADVIASIGLLAVIFLRRED